MQDRMQENPHIIAAGVIYESFSRFGKDLGMLSWFFARDKYIYR